MKTVFDTLPGEVVVFEGAKMPDSINILGQEFPISTEDFGEEQAGEYKWKARKIIIDTNLDPMVEKDVLTHEVLHAISCFIGAELTEEQVTGMSSSILSVLRNNPDLVRWLVA